MSQLYNKAAGLLADQTEAVVEMRKLILKIFHCVTQYFYPLDTISNESCQQWWVLLSLISNMNEKSIIKPDRTSKASKQPQKSIMTLFGALYSKLSVGASF